MSQNKPKDICSQCGAAFECGMEDASKPCWCMELPSIMPVLSDGSTCLCPKCLKEKIAVELLEKVGLCSKCLHAKELKTKNNSPIYLCKLSNKDSHFPKYPRLPIKACSGFAGVIYP